MLKVCLHRLLRDVARSPRPAAYRPEVAPPVSLPQRRVLFLDPAAGAPLHLPNQLLHGLRRRVLDVHVDVVLTHHPLEHPHVLGVADLRQQVAAPHLDVTHQHVVAVFGDPYDVRRQPRRGVPTVPVLFHRRDFYHAAEVCSN